MSPEKQPMRNRAREERANDFRWIKEYLYVFWPLAREIFQERGRGAFVVNTTVQPEETGNPYEYFTQEILEESFGEDFKRIVVGYDPQSEFMVILLKNDERGSTYRVKPLPGLRRE